MELLLLVFLILAVFFAYTAISGAPWVPVRGFDVEELLDDGGVTKGTVYLELGCGDGRLLQAAARRGARAVGYELNPLLWLISWIRSFANKNISVKYGDFWKVSLSDADVVMAFLIPRTMPRLGKKAAAQMKPSAKLISYVFEIPGKKPLKKGKSWLVYSFKKSS